MPQSRLTPGSLWIIGTLVLIDAMILSLTGMRIVWRPVLGVVTGAVLLDILGRVYAGPRDAPRLTLFARLGMRIVLFSAAAETLNMLLCTFVKLPFWDSRFAAADAALGLNWIDFAGWVSAHPVLHGLLSFAYLGLGPELIVLVSLLALMGDASAAIMLWRLFAVTALATIFLATLLPAIGPLVWFSRPGALSVPYVQQYLGLRGGELRTINLVTAQGLITFPSFHACVAMICMWVSRSLGGMLRGLIYVFNMLVIASTPPIGGHYFIDILGGGMIAGGAIFALEFDMIGFCRLRVPSFGPRPPESQRL